MKPIAIFFDWDDTLVDTWHVSFNALNTTRVKMGLNPWTDEEARRARGPSAKDLFTHLFGASRWEEADRIYYQAYLDHIEKNLTVLKGARELLDFLKSKNIIMGVVSNKRPVILKTEIAHLNWHKIYFNDIMIGAGEATEDKPSSAPLLMALDQARLNIGSNHNLSIWYIGDSWSDIACALSAKLCAVHFGLHPLAEDKIKLFKPHLSFQTHEFFMEYIKREFST